MKSPNLHGSSGTPCSATRPLNRRDGTNRLADPSTQAADHVVHLAQLAWVENGHPNKTSQQNLWKNMGSLQIFCWDIPKNWASSQLIIPTKIGMSPKIGMGYDSRTQLRSRLQGFRGPALRFRSAFFGLGK